MEQSFENGSFELIWFHITPLLSSRELRAECCLDLEAPWCNSKNQFLLPYNYPDGNAKKTPPTEEDEFPPRWEMLPQKKARKLWNAQAYY